MNAGFIGRGSLGDLRKIRQGYLTKYLPKKYITDLAKPKRAVHQVVDVEDLLRQFDNVLTKLDEIVQLMPSGLQKKVQDSVDLDELKCSLREDLYGSIKRLQKESRGLNLTKVNIDGKPSFQGKITVPALCGVLASIIETSPYKTAGKRAFIMEALLDSLSFLDDIPGAACAGLDIKEVLRVALQATQEGEYSRSLRGLAAKLVLQSKERTNELVLVDLQTRLWIKNTNNISWAKVDFSPQQLPRIAASQFEDPLMESIRGYLGIRTALEEAGIKEGVARLKAGGKDSTAIGYSEIIDILEDAQSIYKKGGSAEKTAKSAIEATLWLALFTWYKKIAEDPSSSIKGLQIMGDGAGDIKITIHTFLDAKTIRAVSEGKRWAMFKLQEHVAKDGFVTDLFGLGSRNVNRDKPVIDWRHLWTNDVLRRQFDPKFKGIDHRAERLYAFQRAFSEYGFLTNDLTPSKLKKGQVYKGKQYYQFTNLERQTMVIPTDEAMQAIMDGFGFKRMRLEDKSRQWRIAETSAIEQAARSGDVDFRVYGQDFREDLTEVQVDITKTENKQGKSWRTIFSDFIRKAVGKRHLDNNAKAAIKNELLDSIKYWHRRMGLDKQPMTDEDFYLFFADVAMRRGLSRNVEANSAASRIAGTFDYLEWLELDYFTISNLLPGSMQGVLDHLQIYVNVKTGQLRLFAIQDKADIAGKWGMNSKDLAKDLHILKNYIEGLFNEIKSKKNPSRMWGGELGVLYNLHGDDHIRMQQIIDLVRNSKCDIEIFGIQRLTRVEVDTINDKTKNTFDVGIIVIEPDGFSIYKVIQKLKESKVGKRYRNFGERLEDALDLLKQLAPEKVRFFESRMLWGINAEQLSRAEIEEIYTLLRKNIYELAQEKGFKATIDSHFYSDDILEAVGGDYKILGVLYGILDLMRNNRFKIYFESPTLKFWHNKAVDVANPDNISVLPK